MAFLGVEEGQHEDRAIMEEARVFDNRKSSTSSVDTLRIANQVERKLVVDFENWKWSSAGMGGSIFGLIDLKGTIENRLQQKYSRGQASTHIYEITSAITVPAGVCVEVRLKWKLTWLLGVAMIGHQSHELSVPYRVTVGLTYDRESRDVTNG